MMRIGEAAKRFDISNRTLRYWEEMGIINSRRAENGYRFFDDDNMARIRQIVLLRKLKMPIADIERVFIANDFGLAIDALNGHLESLRQDAAAYVSLISLVEQLLRHIKESRNLEHLFTCLESQAAVIDAKREDAPQIRLSERTLSMSIERLDNVRIVRLPAMMVAAYRAESATPEDDCSKVFNMFVLEHNLHKRDGYRFFGFNNPSPSEGNPVYGYEMWVTIPDDFIVPEPLVKKQFDGGLYASVSTRMNEIGERWRLLHEWCQSSDKYDVDFSFQWLEECSMDFEKFISDDVDGNEKQLDLLEPIRAKS